MKSCIFNCWLYFNYKPIHAFHAILFFLLSTLHQHPPPPHPCDLLSCTINFLQTPSVPPSFGWPNLMPTASAVCLCTGHDTGWLMYTSTGCCTLLAYSVCIVLLSSLLYGCRGLWPLEAEEGCRLSSDRLCRVGLCGHGLRPCLCCSCVNFIPVLWWFHWSFYSWYLQS